MKSEHETTEQYLDRINKKQLIELNMYMAECDKRRIECGQKDREILRKDLDNYNHLKNAEALLKESQKTSLILALASLCFFISSAWFLFSNDGIKKENQSLKDQITLRSWAYQPESFQLAQADSILNMTKPLYPMDTAVLNVPNLPFKLLITKK